METLIKTLKDTKTGNNVLPRTRSRAITMEDGTNLDDRLSNFREQLTSLSYQVPVITGTQIRISKHGNMDRLYFKLDSDLSGAITISLDNGITELPLKDIDGNYITFLEKGFTELVYNTTFFTYAPKKVVKSGQHDFKNYSTFELFMRFGFDPIRAIFK